MPRKQNRNIIIIKQFSELQHEMNYSNFEYKDYFAHICDLLPNQQKERLDIEIVDKTNIAKEELVYVLVIEDKIFKIGHTITDIKKRVGSYNCGKTVYRIHGTIQLLIILYSKVF